ncbi:hypothetical protein FQN60_005441 [Etheostoma spectabile]|uniref:triacylglycerol lipase n=1 Tax=Etheostoma spectabile TaxID=54343 RepID=A0A5J5CHA6_9PERO|nr:hypothetical protein FQN60_005441 [Etheostoma spectabile]
MVDLNSGWNLSFAGCGFLGIYHIGVASCLQEKAPYLIEGATKLYGASAGALTASVLASQASLARCCEDVIEVAKEARKRNLGPLHPNFNLVKVLKSGLNRDLPSDAHALASGRLCVSLTRVSDGQNVLVSEFDSKEELVQALICSSFIPIYCGLIPPSFRGVRYVDGGMSNNLPQSELKNTITISPFSGESDICPRDNSTSFHELRFTNTSIQMNLGNMYRLSRALFPPETKVMADMCQNGYKDALRFLEENNLLMLDCPTSGPAMPESPPATCCSTHTETTQDWVQRRLRLLRKQHWWLDEQIVLPTPIKKVFCEACQDKSGLYAKVSKMLPVCGVDPRGASGYAMAVWGSSEPGLRKCLSAPPLPTECEKPMQRDHLPALSSLDLPGNYWEYTKSTSSSSQKHSHIVPSSPQQVCFFVGSQEDLKSPEPQ